MTVLLLAEHDNCSLDPQTARALTAARAMGGEVHLLVAGSGCAVVAEAGRTLGASLVLLADEPGLAHQSAEALAALIVSLAPGYDGIVAAATSVGKSVLPRAAALLDVMQVSEIVAVLAPDIFQRPIYAGNAIETVQTTDPIRVVTVRAAAFLEAPAGATAELATVPVPAGPTLSRFVSATSAATDRPDLTAARVVVSGGRAIYRGKISPADAQRRLDSYWHPYHQALHSLMTHTHDSFGEVILIDCHSMPHEAIETHSRPNLPKPDVVLGDRFGAAAGPDIVEQIESIFMAEGFRVARNAPFAGAYIAQHYGRPLLRKHVVQVEIDRSLYLDETRVEPNSKFGAMSMRLNRVVAEIAQIGRRALPLAAE